MSKALIENLIFGHYWVIFWWEGLTVFFYCCCVFAPLSWHGDLLAVPLGRKAWARKKTPKIKTPKILKLEKLLYFSRTT